MITKSKVDLFGLVLLIILLGTLASFVSSVAHIPAPPPPLSDLPAKVWPKKPLMDLVSAAGLGEDYCNLMKSGARIYNNAPGAGGTVFLVSASADTAAYKTPYTTATMREVLTHLAGSPSAFIGKRVLAEGTWIVQKNSAEKRFLLVDTSKPPPERLEFWAESSEDFQNVYRALVTKSPDNKKTLAKK